MGFIVMTVLLFIVAVVGWFFKFGQQPDPSMSNPDRTKFGVGPKGLPVISLVTLLLWMVMALFACTNSIAAGHIGLVRTFGNYTGQQSPGLNFKLPWQSVDEVNGRVQKATITMNGGERGSAVSKETQPVYAVLTVNYQIELPKARQLYSNVGANYYHAIIEPRVQQAFKAITVKYTTAEIAPHREEIRDQAKAILTKQLEPYGITVNDLLIKNLDFSNAFLAAIEQKQVAGQEALAAEARVASSKAEAEQLIAAAEGKARATAIEGNAIKLNPQILQLRSIEKLNPNVQVIYLPSGTNMFLPSPALK